MSRRKIDATAISNAELRAFEKLVHSISADVRKVADVLRVPDDSEPRELGNFFRPSARGVSADLRELLDKVGFANVDLVFALADHLETTKARIQLHEICVPVPVTTIALAAAILSTVPGTRRGRPRDLSTNEAVELAARLKSVRAAAKIIAAKTGKSEEAVRSSIRAANTKARTKRAKKK
ncbi:hypothetical protein ACT4MK_18265 [Bradyrhizobium barranii]|uniref:hypothetical protein n=1 Tax=Bradyrhizobium barranii TaxID=2992140 RepID=UPI004034A996